MGVTQKKKVIYNHNIAMTLVNKGFKIMSVEPSVRKKNKVVYIFEYTEALKNALDEILQHSAVLRINLINGEMDLIMKAIGTLIGLNKLDNEKVDENKALEEILMNINFLKNLTSSSPKNGKI